MAEKQIIPLLIEDALKEEKLSFFDKILRIVGKNNMRQVFPLKETLHNFSAPYIACREQSASSWIESYHPEHVFILPENYGILNALYAASFYISKTQPDALLMLCGKDHRHYAALSSIIANIHAGQGEFVFLSSASSIVRGETYLQAGRPIEDNIHEIRHVIENLGADSYAQLKNADDIYSFQGSILFSPKSVLRYVEEQYPEIAEKCLNSVNRARRVKQHILLDKDMFLACPQRAIDYSMMKKKNKAYMLINSHNV